MSISLVITAIGLDKPGIVEAISDAGRTCGANWAGSRMANLAGQFAGIVHFEVDEAQVAALENALRALEKSLANEMMVELDLADAGNSQSPL